MQFIKSKCQSNLFNNEIDIYSVHSSPNALCILIQLILTVILWEGYYYHPRFTEEQTEIEFLSIRARIWAHVLKAGPGRYLHTHLRVMALLAVAKRREQRERPRTDERRAECGADLPWRSSAVKTKGILTHAAIMDAPRGHYPITKG